MQCYLSLILLFPRMLHAVVVRRPVAHARIRAVDIGVPVFGHREGVQPDRADLPGQRSVGVSRAASAWDVPWRGFYRDRVMVRVVRVVGMVSVAVTCSRSATAGSGLKPADCEWCHPWLLVVRAVAGVNSRADLGACYEAQATTMVRGESVVHIADITDDDAYRSGDLGRRAVADLGGARSQLMVALRKDNILLGAMTSSGTAFGRDW